MSNTISEIIKIYNLKDGYYKKVGYFNIRNKKVISSIQYCDERDYYHRERNKPSIVDYNISTGFKRIEAYHHHNSQHRDDGKPAWITYHENGNVKVEHYYDGNFLHREGDLPALIEYDENGKILKKEYYNWGTLRDKEEIERRVRLNKRKEILGEWKQKI